LSLSFEAQENRLMLMAIVTNNLFMIDNLRG
jgi:hypothetical protein